MGEETRGREEDSKSSFESSFSSGCMIAGEGDIRRRLDERVSIS